MKIVDVGPFALGIDQAAHETQLKKGALRVADNVNISSTGAVSRRCGYYRALALDDAHSMWASSSGLCLIASGSDLHRVQKTPTGLITTVIWSGLVEGVPLDYCEANGLVYVSSKSVLLEVSAAGVARRVGVATPIHAPAASVSEFGGLAQGEYLMSYSFIDDRGEEGGTSPMTKVVIPEAGGGVQVSPMPVPPVGEPITTVRFYLTTPFGDILYRADDAPVGMSTYLIGKVTPGRACTTQHKVRMRGGSMIRFYNGRLWMAHRRTVWFSESFQPGLISPRKNFVQYGEDIRFIEPVANGVYVGAGDMVYFLAGGGPGQMQNRAVSGLASVAGTSAVIDAQSLGKDYQLENAHYAIWFSAEGWVVGNDRGEVKVLNSDRITTPEYARGKTSILYRNGTKQVITSVQSHDTDSISAPQDSDPLEEPYHAN